MFFNWSDIAVHFSVLRITDLQIESRKFTIIWAAQMDKILMSFHPSEIFFLDFCRTTSVNLTSKNNTYLYIMSHIMSAAFLYFCFKVLTAHSVLCVCKIIVPIYRSYRVIYRCALTHNHKTLGTRVPLGRRV